MDTKALAKSKRAHSLHNKKKHQPHQASKAPSVASDDKKSTGKQAKERAPRNHGPKPLPSNWERYDEDLDLDSDEAQASSSQPSEFVAPKSKGADYAHLISEAKVQSQAHYSADALPLLNDFINDFTQDFGPMLAAKGQSILSWIADDSFEFEGKASTSVEAPFLNLNLNALAEQLAKAKLSERLYLEPDLLPVELLDDELQPYGEDKHDPQTCTSETETNSGASSLSYNQEVSKNVEQHEPASSTITATGDIPVQTSDEGLKPVKQSKGEVLHSQGTDRSISAESVSKRITDSFSGKPPISGAASAEAELDMLLNSFDETKILESSGASLIEIPSIAAASGETVRKGIHTAGPAVIKANIDDDIDKLLESSSASSIGIPSIAAASGETVKKGTHTTGPAVITANIDDDIDKLLEETSNLTIIDDRQQLHGSKANTETMSSTVHPSSKSRLLDDFDSWLDTI